jgi:hypothetical protein
VRFLYPSSGSQQWPFYARRYFGSHTQLPEIWWVFVCCCCCRWWLGV